MSWARAAHRSRQFFGALRPRLGEDDRAFAGWHLAPDLLALFDGMTPRDQRHALDVARTLLAEGEADARLLQAALLHDVGKGSPRLWHRVAFVVFQALSPRLLTRLAPPGSAGWRAPFDRLLRHGVLGAAMLDEAGANAETVHLVRYHEDPGVSDALLDRLRSADDRC